MKWLVTGFRNAVMFNCETCSKKAARIMAAGLRRNEYLLVRVTPLYESHEREAREAQAAAFGCVLMGAFLALLVWAAAYSIRYVFRWAMSEPAPVSICERCGRTLLVGGHSDCEAEQ